MKYWIIAVSFLMLTTACLNNTDKEQGATGVPSYNKIPAADSANYTKIEWLDSSKSLGTITQGQVLKISYRFKNTGEKPLIIQRVQPGCGCTVADYPKEPIAPGKEGLIQAEFDSKGKEGVQHKNIMVYANTPELMHTLWFDVTINK